MQKFRGGAYLSDGAIHAFELDSVGRHVQASDPLSWHFVNVNERNRVLSCARFRACRMGIPYKELGVSKSALARHPSWGMALRRSVQSKIAAGITEGYMVAETGGWAVANELRGTREALKVVLSMYALGACFGRTIALCTATTRHGSSSILRRIGAESLEWMGTPLPPYYDPAYSCDMEILVFDSAKVDAKYHELAEECRRLLVAQPVVCATAESDLESKSLFNLAVNLMPDFPVRVHDRVSAIAGTYLAC
jgi:hypothetical protein